MDEIGAVDDHWESEGGSPAPERKVNRLIDVQLANLTLLMRIYDQQMVIIEELKRNRGLTPESARAAVANLFDLHQNGQTNNPDIWLEGPE